MSQQINLYHPIFRKQKKTFSARAILNAALVLIAGIVLMYGYTSWRVYQLRAEISLSGQRQALANKRLQSVTRQFTRPSRDIVLEREVRRHEQLLAARNKIREILQQGIFTNTTGYSSYFIALARQYTRGVWLTEISITGAGEKMTLKGRSTLANRVPRYLQRLSREKTLSGIEFDVFQIARPEEEKKEIPVKYVEFVAKTVIRKERIIRE